MGMIQYYLRADDAKVKEIQEGDSVFHSSSDDDKMLDIDKAWHAIHFTLTGEVWDFREKFDLKAMIENKVYPVMDEEEEEQFFEYVWFYFKEVKKFFRQAADQGENVISVVC